MLTQTLAAVTTVVVVAGILVQLLATLRLGARLARARRPRPAPAPEPRAPRLRRRYRDYRAALHAARHLRALATAR